MLLSITTTHQPATDLGYLLHKHPDRLHTTDLGFGRARVFYPEASVERCTAVLLLEINPVELVRGHARGRTGRLEDYVSDRPYVASSFLSVALSRVLGTALAGRSKERPELATTAIPLETHLPVLPARGGEGIVRSLFGPLGYEVELKHLPLDERFPEWGMSRYVDLRLRAVRPLHELLTHLYVLVPVLDDEKHYWVGEEEVEKLLRRGDGWLQGHPERDLIVRRYLRYQRHLTRDALARLTEEDQPDPEAAQVEHAQEETRLEERIGLHEQRLRAVADLLRERDVRSVIDLGCGDGRLLARLQQDRLFTKLAAMDVSLRALEAARNRLGLDRIPPGRRDRIELFHGSLVYRDARLQGYDAATAIEVIEHLDPWRLATLERVLFEFARPRVAIVTTPNREYNVRFERLPAGALRHRDHRFEWTRDEFRGWANAIATRFGYQVELGGVGPEDVAAGAPTQMAIFMVVQHG